MSLKNLKELKYLAGLLDGSGSLMWEKTGPRSWRPVLAITHRHPQLIAGLKELGGLVIERKPKNPKHQVSYTWKLMGEEAIKVLTKLAPHLNSFKKSRAELLTNYWWDIQAEQNKDTQLELKQKLERSLQEL